MKAILYVAGRANRLAGIVRPPNKILLEFGRETLLERHVRLLAEIGVRELHVVTGHAAEAVRAEFPGLQARHGVRIGEFYNPDFVEGSLLSFKASLPALQNITEQVLLMDGDVLYDWRMLDALMRSQHPSVLLIDRGYSKDDNDPVLVPLRAGRPFEFTKGYTGEAEVIGESIGFFKVAPAAIAAMIQDVENRDPQQARTLSYDDVLRSVIQQGHFDVEDVTGIPWTEIDFPYDLDYARDTIFPALQERISKP
jgi:choline kinase